MKPRDVLQLLIPALWIVMPAVMRGDLVTDSSLFPAPAVVIDFSQFSGSVTRVFSTPVQVGSAAGVDVTLTSNNPDGSFVGSGPYPLADNGTWDSSVALAGLDVDNAGSDQYTMTFQFNSGPVSAVGGFFNYASFDGSGFSDVILSALGAGDTVLESWDVNDLAPISTPGGIDAGEFLAIIRPDADITAFSISNSAAAITDLTFSATPSETAVPEPASWGPSAVCLLLVVLRRFRHRA